MLQCGKLITA